MNKLGPLVFGIGLLAVSVGCVSGEREVYVRPAEPPPEVEVVGTAPYAGAVWVKGHWNWHPRHRRYAWVKGHWGR